MAVEHDPPAVYDDINVRSIALVGGVGAVLVFVAIVAVQVIYFRYNDAEYEQKVIAVPAAQADRTLATQRAKLDTTGQPGAIPENGETTIPISEAMVAVLKDYERRNQEAASTGADPVADPAADPAADPPVNEQGPDGAEDDGSGAAAEQPAAE